MAEVNEEILEQYLKVVKKWFYVTDIPFAVPHNYSNIDVLSYDPVNKKYYDFEVKFRSAFSLPNNQESTDYLVEQFNKYAPQRNAKLREFAGRRRPVRVIVTTRTMIGKSQLKKTEMEKRFRRRMRDLGYTADIWYFDDMIPELVENVESTGRYNTQLLQTIRLLKIYGSA